MSESGEVPRKRLTYGRGPRHEIETASGAPGYIESDLTLAETEEAVRTYKALRGMYLRVVHKITGSFSDPIERQDVAEKLRCTWFYDAHDGITAALVVLQRKLNAHEYTGEQEAYLGIRIEKAPDDVLFSAAIADELRRRAQRVNFPKGFSGVKRDEECNGC